MPKVKIKGIIPPITTPFLKGKVAYDNLSFNIEKWNKTGISGFVVLGSNGEYIYLSEEEKRQVVKTVVNSASKDKLVIAGTGCESTRETIRLTQDCAQLGASIALIITPAYYGNKMNSKALINHYITVADNSTIPILLYSVPKFTHLNLEVEIVAELSRHPNITGIKDSSGNINQLGDYINNTGENFNVLVGTAGALLGALCTGCNGGILALANIAPETCVKIYNLVQENNFEEAKKLQLEMIPVNKAVTVTYGISGLKAALDMLGYFGGEARLPLLPVSDEERKKIEGILVKARLL